VIGASSGVATTDGPGLKIGVSSGAAIAGRSDIAAFFPTIFSYSESDTITGNVASILAPTG
jgi:hypothetical protein